MKQTKVVVLTMILTLVAFGSVVYTSCKKDLCKRMNCRNGGTCSEGFCTCPVGYTGTYCQTPNVSNIGLRNETFTTVYVTIGGADYSVDSGKTLTFTGGYADTLKGTAWTVGRYGMNVTIAPFKVAFPARNTTIHTLDVGPEYFFLMATNHNSTVPFITQVHVNYKQPDSTLDITEIRNDSKPYHIGYFKATDSTRVRLEKTPNYWMFNTLALPGTVNQYYNAVVN